MTACTSADRDAIIRTVFGEARGEPEEGQAAVTHVILNRAARPAWWGRTPAECCAKPFQFSCWLKNDPNRCKLDALCPSDDEYQRVAVTVDAVLNGHLPDPTGSATHYKVTGTKASWDVAVAKIVPVIIGRHSFYDLGPEA